MDEGQVKTKIFLMQSLDWALFIAVVSLGIYAVIYAENRALMGFAALVGLFLVSKLGNYTMVKINTLRLEMKIQKREQGKL